MKSKHSDGGIEEIAYNSLKSCCFTNCITFFVRLNQLDLHILIAEGLLKTEHVTIIKEQ